MRQAKLEYLPEYLQVLLDAAQQFVKIDVDQILMNFSDVWWLSKPQPIREGGLYRALLQEAAPAFPQIEDTLLKKTLQVCQESIVTWGKHRWVSVRGPVTALLKYPQGNHLLGWTVINPPHRKDPVYLLLDSLTFLYNDFRVIPRDPDWLSATDYYNPTKPLRFSERGYYMLILESESST